LYAVFFNPISSEFKNPGKKPCNGAYRDTKSGLTLFVLGMVPFFPPARIGPGLHEHGVRCHHQPVSPRCQRFG